MAMIKIPIERKDGRERVVRCWDCAHYPYRPTPLLSDRVSFKTYRHCWDFPYDGYCHMGERKDDGKND